MSTFGSPWKDIDETLPGKPYVVDSDGWGGFALFILLALPFFIVGILLTQGAIIICEHPLLSSAVYLICSLLLGIVLYRSRQKRWRPLGIIATILNLLPFALVEGFYMIPYMMQHSLFAFVFEWIFVTVVVGGLTFSILIIAHKLSSGLVHFLSASLFFLIVFLILNSVLSSSDDLNWAIAFSVYS